MSQPNTDLSSQRLLLPTSTNSTGGLPLSSVNQSWDQQPVASIPTDQDREMDEDEQNLAPKKVKIINPRRTSDPAGMLIEQGFLSFLLTYFSMFWLKL